MRRLMGGRPRFLVVVGERFAAAAHLVVDRAAEQAAVVQPAALPSDCQGLPIRSLE